MIRRTTAEIIECAYINALERLRNEEPKQRIVKRTGNKKALHQKSKNRRPVWTN